MFRIILLFLILCIGCSSPVGTVESVVSGSSRSVFKLKTGDGICTGFYIGYRLMVTSAHCLVDDLSKPELVYVIDAEDELSDTEVLIFDTLNDLAILATEDLNVPGLAIWDDTVDGPLRIGQHIVALGYPSYYFGDFTFNVGYIIDIHKFSGKRDLLFSKSIIYPGQSGGPIIDVSTGKVIGVAEAMMERIFVFKERHQHNTLNLITPYTKINNLLHTLSFPAATISSTKPADVR